MTELPEGVTYCSASRCWECGRTVNHKPYGGPRRFHFCSLRFLSRRFWRGHLEGWHSGYRWAVENPTDPMVLADGFDYGSGWAGHMRVGHVTITAEDSDV